MIGREHRQALQRGGDRRVQQLGQLDQLRLRVARAPADEQADLFVVWRGHGFVSSFLSTRRSF